MVAWGQWSPKSEEEEVKSKEKLNWVTDRKQITWKRRYKG